MRAAGGDAQRRAGDPRGGERLHRRDVAVHARHRDALAPQRDAKGEHELFARIRELFAERSVLLISHRFSTVREADRIYVLEDGAVAQAGSHEELMARDGRYAEPFSLQALAYA